MSLNDLYNHLKVFEPEVQKKSESNSHNMAFISSAKNSSGKREGNTASIPAASTQVSPVSADVVAASFSHDTVCAYITSQSNGCHKVYDRRQSLAFGSAIQVSQTFAILVVIKVRTEYSLDDW
nr:hypothetical protein [Tanacetum cinerariifolium]